MRKEDIINKCEKVIYDNDTVYFIIQTIPETDFWFWQVQKADIIEYFSSRNKKAVFELASEKLSKRNCELFINDIDNNMLGSSCGSFVTIEECIKEVLR